MSKKSKVFLIVLCWLLIAAVTVFVGLKMVVIVDNSVYFRGKTMDLRGEALTEDDYLQIAGEAPDSRIIWDVPCMGTVIPSNTVKLNVQQLTDADMDMLRYMTELQVISLGECSDYNLLQTLKQRYPGVSLEFSITVDGKPYRQDAKSITVDVLTRELMELLPCFPALNALECTTCEDYDMLLELQQAHPDWDIRFGVLLGEDILPRDARTAQARGADEQSLRDALRIMTELQELRLVNPSIDGDTLTAIAAENPQRKITWCVEYDGKVFESDVTEVDISGSQVASCEEIEALVACLPKLEKLVMCDCGIPSETMAEFRERQRPNYKVVWRVYIGSKCQLRTDATWFMPIDQGEYYMQDKHTAELKYCEDMVCLDVGHHMIHDISFIEYMPHLKYLILAHTGVREIKSLTGCKELIYLELDWSEVQDITGLDQLTALEDLNIGRTGCDVSVLANMPWLKNVWLTDNPTARRQALTEALPDTRLVFGNVASDGTGWRNLPNYYAMRDYLGKPYMK